MLYQEAEWLSRTLDRIPVVELSPMLNIGSSTREFRERIQPHIHSLIFTRLAARGVRAVHCDLKEADGVDISGDIFDDATLDAMRQVQASSVLCANMFEHVENRQSLADRLLSLVPPGGLIILTVPRSYPYHKDPIDTLYRPSPQALAELFPNTEIVSGEIINAGSYRDKLAKKPWRLLGHLLRLFTPFYRYQRWQQSVGKLYWIVHPYQVTCLILKKS
jgi:hypothetical protein